MTPKRKTPVTSRGLTQQRRSNGNGNTPADPTQGPYVYHDSEGKPLYRVVRKPGKEFHQERYEDGRWISGIAGVQRVLYNLPAVSQAVRLGQEIYVVEGEKDVIALGQAGVVATTNPMGEGKWRDEYSQALAGAARVIVVPDRDNVGRKHALAVEASLKRVGVPVGMRRAKVGKDASDHLAAGYTVAQLVRRRPKPPAAPKDANGTDPTGAEYRQGSRNHELTSWAGRLRRAGLDRAELEVVLAEFNKLRCKPPLPQREVADIARSIAQYPAGAKDASERVQEELEKMRAREDARSIFLAETVKVNYRVPRRGRTLADAVKDAPPRLGHVIDRLHTEGGNTLLVAQYKTGKSRLMNNVMLALADGTPFLGEFDVKFDRRIGVLQYELTEQMSLSWWSDLGIEHSERVAEPWQLRGYSLPLAIDSVRDDLVNWCLDEDIGALILDPAMMAWQGFLESENDNMGVTRFTARLDEIKRLGSVDELWLTTHTGRGTMAEGDERARGATRLEDWMDHGWYLTKDDSGLRSMRALGREVDVEAFDLQYDMDTGRSTHAGRTRKQRREEADGDKVVLALAALRDDKKYPAQTEWLTDALTDVAGSKRNKVVRNAVDAGYVRRESLGKAYLHTLTDKGEIVYQQHHQRLGQSE